MGCWKSWLSSMNSLLFKFTSLLKHKTEEKRAGLVSLYKDIEESEGYADIQVMWKIINSSSLPMDHSIGIRKTAHRRVRFRET